MMSGKRKFVIDCDVGTDDAQAIMMTLVQPDIELLAVTTVEGNAPIENTTRNTLRLLNFCQVKVPVYQGCNRTLLGYNGCGKGFHGIDGMGDIEDDYPPDESLLQQEHAAIALTRLAKENKGDVTLIAVGPLTNLAMAIRLDPNFGQNLKDCFIMGGIESGQGCATQIAEFNFCSDPEAAMVVLNQLKCPITVAALEICVKTSFSWEWYNKFISINTKKAKFIKEIDKIYVENCKKLLNVYACWDQLAVGAAILPAMVTETQSVYATVEIHGVLTRGQMVVDTRGELGKPPNVKLITGVDMALYEQLYYDMVNK